MKFRIYRKSRNGGAIRRLPEDGRPALMMAGRKLENGKEVKDMMWEESIDRVLDLITRTAASLADMAECEELLHNMDAQSSLIQSVLDAETETAEFIESFGLHEINVDAVKHCKTRFIEINQQILMHIQKIQSHGYNLGSICSTVQLEIMTLSKELSLLG